MIRLDFLVLVIVKLILNTKFIKSYKLFHQNFIFTHVCFFFILPDDASFSSWSTWASCSSGCQGATYKTRECSLDNETQCVSSTNATMDCSAEICPGGLAL